MSELIFVGTGAADWDINNKTEDFRRFSSALLNGEMMLDCGPHIFDYATDFACEDLYDGVAYILLSHTHGDHFKKESVLALAQRQKICVLCDGHKKELIGEHENITYIELEPLVDVTVGGYTITPLLANHMMVMDGNHYAFHFIIKTPDEKTLFYGLDGAWFLCPSWARMCQETYDVMLFDATVGDSDDWRLFEHNTVPMLRMMLTGIKEKELLKPEGKYVAAHLARTLHPSKAETEKIFAECGMLTAYDGMKLDF